MNGILNGLLRWVVVMVICLATIWPDYGIGWLSWKWLPAYPVPVMIFDLLWIVVLALALPFTLHWFRIATSASFLALTGVVVYEVWTVYPNLINSGAGLIITAGIAVGFLFGWWKIATPLWRWANGIIVTQHTGVDHVGHDGS